MIIMKDSNLQLNQILIRVWFQYLCTNYLYWKKKKENSYKFSREIVSTFFGLTVIVENCSIFIRFVALNQTNKFKCLIEQKYIIKFKYKWYFS